MKINLSHGNGATEMSELIESVFMKQFRNEWNAGMEDAALLELGIPGLEGKKIAFTTDSFVVKPLFFPGGDIGRLAVCGTVNDLLTTGSKPLFLSAAFIIEEGAESEELAAIAASMRETAEEAGVYIVTGDTKVIEKGGGDVGGVYINTAGVGVVSAGAVSTRLVRPGDAIIVTGNLGDHHACILSARMGIKNNIESDAAPLTDIVGKLVQSELPLHGMRDITRGGLATVLNEIAAAAGLRAVIEEGALPVSDGVKGLCGILGLDPLYMGNEGKMLIIVPEEQARRALNVIRRARYGQDAEIVGSFCEAGSDFSGSSGAVLLKTRLGGRRILPAMSGEGLPRIC